LEYRNWKTQRGQSVFPAEELFYFKALSQINKNGQMIHYPSKKKLEKSRTFHLESTFGYKDYPIKFWYQTPFGPVRTIIWSLRFTKKLAKSKFGRSNSTDQSKIINALSLHHHDDQAWWN